MTVRQKEEFTKASESLDNTVQSVQCPGKCGLYNFSKDSMLVHYNECPSVLYKCACLRYLYYKDQEQHSKVCEEIQVTCPDCAETFLRKDEDDHDCKNVIDD